MISSGKEESSSVNKVRLMNEKGKAYSRRKFIKKAGLTAAALPLVASGTIPFSETKKERRAVRIPGAGTPNIIYILSDDHRYDFMGFMGKPKFLNTPSLDKMARDGAHLQNAFVTTSLCSPSRASILTGMYSHKHGVVDNDSLVPADNVFFPRYLQQVGYETAFMGKWHMGSESDEPRKSFDKWISFKGQGVYYDPLMNIDGSHVQRKGYITDILTDYAVEYIKEKSSAAEQEKKPFFLYLSHKAVHAMFEPAERHKGKYDNVKIDYPDTMANTKENYADKPRWVEAQRYGWHGVDYLYQGQLEFDEFYRKYCETILALDEGIGAVLDALTETGLDKNTVVFYMSDNGFSLGEHGLIDKRQMYEESMRIPLIAYAPGLITPSTKISELVQNIDIAPTILELAGIKTPGDMDGRSFLPLLKGEAADWRDRVFYEYFWERPFPHTPTVFGVRTNKYKYMTFWGIWDVDELYDIENDPEEKHNLIKSPEHQELIKDLNQRVYAWLEATGGMQIPLKKDIFWRADKRKPGH
jgi:N-acetylglucosamine-6-sulfatase